ncbi:MAG: nuclear transport factor 2 family protein [Frankiaceae bacterium]|nr:nuclear transport factor 2 family protein [Frankiaceae bacterium]
MTTTHPDVSTTASEHPNVGRMRAAFAAFAAGDLDAVRASMTPDATWINGGSNPLAGTHRGWEEISAMFGKLMELTEFTYTMNVLDMMATDQHAVAVYDATSTIQGRTATTRWTLVDEVTPDGLVSATYLLAYDQEAADAQMNG